MLVFQNAKSIKKLLNKIWLGVMTREHKIYNEEINTSNKKLKENLHRKDHKYDYIISISHNEKKIPGKGSAVFIHLNR